MGENTSKLFKTKWRPDPKGLESWNEKGEQNMRNLVKDCSHAIKSEFKGEYVRILIFGYSGAGKSAFVNLVNSAVTQTSGAVAVEANIGAHVTKMYKEYRIATNDREWELPFRLCDFLGFGSEQHGASEKCVEKALAGEFRDGDWIDPTEVAKEDTANSLPGQSKLANMVLLVVDGNSLLSSKMKEDEELGRVNQIKSAVKAAVNKGVPVAVIITKCDLVCPHVKVSVKNLYYSPAIKTLVQKTSQALGIRENRVFPVVNYSSLDAPLYHNHDMSIQVLIPLNILLEDLFQQLKQRQFEKEGGQEETQSPNKEVKIITHNVNDEHRSDDGLLEANVDNDGATIGNTNPLTSPDDESASDIERSRKERSRLKNTERV